jgi:hypothetical protein
MVKQLPLKIRGYSLCDSDWRAWPLQRLGELGEKEGIMLARLESEEPMSDREYTKINQDLDKVIEETKSVLDFYVVPNLGHWWTGRNGL